MTSRFSSLAALGILSVSLAACSSPADTPATPPEGQQSSSAAAVSSAPAKGPSVSYTGKLEKAGISIYMEGTHRLFLDDGGFLLLESDTVALDTYTGKRVTVTGSVRSTVEGNARLMAVEEVSVEPEAAPDEPVDTGTSDSSSVPSASSSAAPAPTPPPADEPAPPALPPELPPVAPSDEDQSSSSSASAPDATVSADVEARAALMAKDNLDPAYWTQQYCSSHIGFCLKVHKNWWYKSFGTTTSSLWHVELNTEDILNLGDGPIGISLVSGAAGSDDGTVKVVGDKAVGYRAWTEDRHFEISGPVMLQAAIEYVTKGITTYDVTAP